MIKKKTFWARGKGRLRTSAVKSALLQNTEYYKSFLQYTQGHAHCTWNLDNTSQTLSC